MKKILFTILMLWGVVQAQITVPPGYTSINSRYNWLAGAFNALSLPTGCGAATLKTGQWVRAGAVYLDSCSDNLYYYSSGTWHNVNSGGGGSGGGISEVLAGYGLIAVNDSTLRVDTSFIRTVINSYSRGQSDSAYALKLNISDSAAMLLPYVRATRQINTDITLTGGGDLSANRTLKVDTTVIATPHDITVARSKLSRTFELVSDSIKMSYEANVRDYGAVGDGTTNDYTAITAAVATGKTIYFPPGTYYVNPPTTNGIQLQAGQRIYGEGNLSTLKITTDEVIIFTNDDNIIENLRFLGSGKNTASLPLQSGVMSYQRKRSIVKSCWFEGFAGDGTNTRYGGAISVSNVNATTPFYNGITVSDCKFIENNIGLYLGLQGEYCAISNSLFGQNNTGALITAGNYTLSNNHFVQNTLGIKLDSLFNSGHGTITGGSFNHNTKMFELNKLDVGHTFSGVMFYYGDASITDCIAVKFVGCDIWGSGGNDVWTLTNNVALVISNSKFTRNNVLHGYIVVTVVSGETFAYSNNTEVSQN